MKPRYDVWYKTSSARLKRSQQERRKQSKNIIHERKSAKKKKKKKKKKGGSLECPAGRVDADSNRRKAKHLLNGNENGFG
jgi:ATPase subunit of ABC transporter with duplicated ATPase domains